MACIQIGGVTDIPGVSGFNIDEFAVCIGTKDQTCDTVSSVLTIQ